MTAHRRLFPLALALVAAALLAGCTAPPSASEPPSTSVATTPPPSTADNGAEEAGIDPDDPPEALGSTEIPTPLPGIESTLVEVVGLRHVDDTLVMAVRITPRGDDSATARIEPITAFTALGDSTFAPQVIDYENLKLYTDVVVLRTNDLIASSLPNEAMYLTATFAYPEGAEVVDVQVTTASLPIGDLPVPR